MTQKAQKIVSLFPELTVSELWAIAHAALARIHAQSEDIDIPETVKMQVQQDSELFKQGKLPTFSLDEVIQDIRAAL